MKNPLIQAGYRTKKIETVNGVTRLGLTDKKGRVLHYEGHPYFPCGGVDAFRALLLTGDLDGNPALTFHFVIGKIL